MSKNAKIKDSFLKNTIPDDAWTDADWASPMNAGKQKGDPVPDNNYGLKPNDKSLPKDPMGFLSDVKSVKEKG